jgi:multiple antibiotic resistance protein
VAGPSSIATVLLLVGQAPARWPEWLGAVGLAWLATAAIVLLAPKLSALLGKRGVSALERLMGLILTTVAVEMFLQGVRIVLRE